MVGQELALEGLLGGRIAADRPIPIEHRRFEQAQLEFDMGRHRAIGEQAIEVDSVPQKAGNHRRIQHVGEDRVVEPVQERQAIGGGGKPENSTGILCLAAPTPIGKDGESVGGKGLNARVHNPIGDPLKAGDVILAGALGPMKPFEAGEYVIEIDGFPALTVRASS